MAANPPPATLAEALVVIDRQAEEIKRLQLQHADARLAGELRAALVRSALAGTIAVPVTHSRLLEMIVETAAQVISSQAASLFLVDEERRELVFEIALGQKSEEVKKFRVPLGHGIAGHVAATGQPTATSGTGDPRQAREIGEIVGYVPQTILCVPLFYADRVIGVLELLDKSDGASFTMLDMQVLGRFANMAAVAIEQSRTRESLSAVIAEMVLEFSTGNLPDEQREHMIAGMQRLAGDIAGDERYQQALRLVRLVEEISRAGDHELGVCEAMLRPFAEYVRWRPQPLAGILELNFSR
ncbi:MAG TPA: GAF domain-containing protein [Chloroflexota bacterium]|nr:GAF domain-containing protein [Chloroflexota bacterium]